MKNLRQLLYGYLLIFGVYFLVKALLYHGYTIRRGVVVDTRYISVSNLKGSSAHSYYPVVVFEGPLKPGTEELRKKATETKADSSSLSAYTRNIKGEDSNRVADTGNIYTTQPPVGSYFIKKYRLGDSLDVFYDAQDPLEATVLSFSSYWLPLTALFILVLFCFIWTGIFNYIKMDKDP